MATIFRGQSTLEYICSVIWGVYPGPLDLSAVARHTAHYNIYIRNQLHCHLPTQQTTGLNIGFRKVNVLLYCTWQEVFQIMQKRSVCYLTICSMKNHEINFLTFLPNTKHTIILVQKIHTSSLEYHVGELQWHCRVCGGRLNKAKRKVQPIYSCSDYPEDQGFCRD